MTRRIVDKSVTLIREAFLVVTTVVMAGLAAIVLFRGDEPAGRIMVLATGCGIAASVLTDWRSAAGLMLSAAVVFVIYLAGRPDMPSDRPASMAYTPVIGLAVMLGRGYRSMAGQDETPG